MRVREMGLAVVTLVAVALGGARGQFAPGEECTCSVYGSAVEGCPCDEDSIDVFNNAKLWPLMQKILAQDFFRYYRVNMEKPCPFWKDERQCSSEKCGIETCDDQVPVALREPPQVDPPCETDEAGNSIDPLDTTISGAALEAFQTWREHDDAENKFCDADDDVSEDLHYVDLLLNPERYTGYKGNSAARVWQSIYRENCFKPHPKHDKNFLLHPTITGLCLEKRVFFRIISGLHSSITVSIAANNFKETPSAFPGGPVQGTWERNTNMFRGRFSPETTWGEGPGRLRNMYFLYLLEARALQKVGPYLKQEMFFTDNEEQDEETRSLVAQLQTVLGQLNGHFEENAMFQGAYSRELKEEFRLHFLNISRIMDCVDCDKCRLWGKLQMHGIGAALKILLSPDVPPPTQPDAPLNLRRERTEIPFQLTRNEVVALFNSFGRFAANIAEVDAFREDLAPARKTEL